MIVSAADSIASFTRALWARTTVPSANGAASNSIPASSFEIILRRTSDGGLSTGAKAGIGVGVALGVIFAITLIWCCFSARRSARYGAAKRPARYDAAPAELDGSAAWSMPVNEWRLSTASRQPKPVCSQTGIFESKTSSNIWTGYRTPSSAHRTCSSWGSRQFCCMKR